MPWTVILIVATSFENSRGIANRREIDKILVVKDPSTFAPNGAMPACCGDPCGTLHANRSVAALAPTHHGLKASSFWAHRDPYHDQPLSLTPVSPRPLSLHCNPLARAT
ncbi:hypothetical protein THAOC_17456 [Thalassiosira oceanica]|uniref:Uncharacterized protein n=1 Tax=Thalassiosira oceanica TaxID=159749 RepID=K0S738_THAOC|nr:hypothetical protein THAOC_17456 [Thalassiosira oceanica]|eukprot:EJK61963.1 hypothetical protein THAOC_17456 [Thalassiosira oceanica]